jgi:hypothetical protein
VPPAFRDATFEQNVRVNEGQSWTLACYVIGNPQPEIVWHKDGAPIQPNSIDGPVLTDDNQLLRVDHITIGGRSRAAANSRYSCMAKVNSRVTPGILLFNYVV